MDNEIKEYIKEQIEKIEKKLEEFTEKITGKEKEEIKTELSGWDRFKAKFQRFLGWIGVIISIILFCVIWFIGWLIEASKRVAVPTVSREYLGILGVLAVILFIYYANKWYYAEPLDKSIKEKERVARLKLIGILMMLFAGTLVFWFILYVFFVYFVGWTNSELISCWQLWLVGPVISWILLLTLPGTGRIITKTIICVCIVAILISIAGLYFDVRPIPPEVRVAKEVISQGYKESVRSHIEKIKEFKKRLTSARSLDEEKKIIAEIQKEVEICRKIRKRYSMLENRKEKKIIFLKPLYRMDFSYPWEPGLKKAKKVFRKQGAFPGIAQAVRLVSQYKNRIIFESGKDIKVKFVGEFKDDNYRGKWIKYTERRVISTGGFELKFYGCCNEAGVGRWWFSCRPREKYVLYFY